MARMQGIWLKIRDAIEAALEADAIVYVLLIAYGGLWGWLGRRRDTRKKWPKKRAGA